MPRFRTTAIAALAASALLATSGAAYARDLHLKKIAREASEAPSMSWAYSKGKLSDLSTASPDVFDGARATAFMMGINGESTFRLNVRGIDKDAVGKTYPAHLHEGPCVEGQGALAGGHYNADKENGSSSWEATSDNEAWLTFKVYSGGSARVTVSVPFVPTPRPDGAARSIVIHTDDKSVSPPPKLACLPLDIKTLRSSN